MIVSFILVEKICNWY